MRINLPLSIFFAFFVLCLLDPLSPFPSLLRTYRQHVRNMGRFTKDSTNYVRSVAMKPTGQIPSGMDDCEAKSTPTGTCRVAETGLLKPRSSPVITRIRSNLVLKAHRMAIFQSPAFKDRLRNEIRVPRAHDATASTLGLIRTALDPQYRDRQLGNVWHHMEGLHTKQQVRDSLVNEAKDGWDRDMQRGKYKRRQSILRHETPMGYRRSERLARLKKSPHRSPFIKNRL
jgi:hypothetical protein